MKNNSEKSEEKFSLAKYGEDLWYLLKGYKKDLYILAIFAFLVAALALIDPFIIKLIIDSLLELDSASLPKMIILVMVMFLVNRVVSNIIYYFDRRGIGLLIGVERDLPVKAQEKMLHLSLAYHERENTGNKITKIQKGADKLVQLLANIFWDILPTVFQVFVTTIVLFVVDFRFGLFFVISVPLFMFITLKGNKQVSPQRKIRQDGYEEASGIMTQSIININTVKSFTQEEREKTLLVNIANSIRKNSYFEFFTMFRFGLYRGLVVDVSLVAIICFGIFLILQGDMSVGSLVFVITVSQKALLSLYRISRIYDKVMESYEPISRIKKLFTAKNDIVNKQNSKKVKTIKGNISFKNVSFSYSNSHDRALYDVSLNIKSGTTVALIGPSGGGKTTTARMIYRHYDPQSGSVQIDGVDLRDYNLNSFRSHISIVPQEVDIFSTSIRANISYGKPNAGIEEIEEAAFIANADEFINKFEEGYETEVGERGIKLSGGQRQRIGIARAVLANPRILIFDEATSNLDSYSEKLIQNALSRICKNRTVIIIAHRLSTIKKADKIFVLENGRIAEQGNHRELSSREGGLYSKLLKLQEVGDIG
jgi:ATP-binding cassette, subfamily B, bacterial